MELYTEKTNKLFELISSNNMSNKSFIIMKKRVLVGSSDICDFIISSKASAIHAIIEISNNGFKVYDMNSHLGTFLNGEKVVAKNFDLGSTISFGKEEYIFKDYKKEDVFPPSLVMLEPEKLLSSSSASLPKPIQISADTTIEEIVHPKVPRVEYPLALDINADKKEYIFEDVETLYPIFKYEIEPYGVEVIILFNSSIYSVDYIPAKNGTYSLVGFGDNSNSIEFAYLGKKDKVPFVEIKNDEISIHSLPGYDEAHIGDGVKNGNLIKALNDNDVFRFINGDLQIFVKKTSAPPKVTRAPIFRRDAEFKKYLFLCLIFAFAFIAFSKMFKVDHELEKEKAPERLATILYKKIPKIKRKKLKIDKKIKKIKKVVKKIAKKKAPKKKIVKKVAKRKSTPKKGKPTFNPVKTIKKNIAKTNKRKVLKSKSARRSARRAKKKYSKGKVDTFKSFDFKSTLSSMMAKGGSSSKFKVNKSGVGTSNSFEVTRNSSGKTVKLNAISKNVGSIKGASRGKIDNRQGVRGLVQKRSIYTDGVPYKTVILGGLDPDVILQILIENIPQFRYCYQKQLDIAKKAFSGVVKLNFLIGASGYVTRANVSSSSNLPNAVKGCVVNVLKGIAFPEPRGGGVVEVVQPMNFLAKKR